jgi:hypothetical protein
MTSPLRLALHRRVLWVLALDPVPRPTGAVGRAKALRHDAFEPEPASVAKHDVARARQCVRSSADRSPSPARKRAGLELKPVHPSSQQVEDVVYDMGRDYDVMNRQREGVVGAGIIKR